MVPSWGEIIKEIQVDQRIEPICHDQAQIADDFTKRIEFCGITKDIDFTSGPSSADIRVKNKLTSFSNVCSYK